MIIDLILERHDNESDGNFTYNAHDFYFAVYDYWRIDGMGKKILYAMDELEEHDVKKALCDYVKQNGYNDKICDFINARKWIENDNGNAMPIVSITDELLVLDCEYKNHDNGICYVKYFAIDDVENALQAYNNALQNDLYSKVTLEKRG